MNTKKVFLVIILIIFNFKLSYSQNFIDSLGMKQGIWDFEGNFDSVLFIKPLVQCNYLNDTLHGIYRKFDSRKNLRYEVNYIKGSRIGLGQIFDSKMNLIVLIQYENGLTKTVFRFHKKSKLYEIIEYDFGKKNGLNILFYKNGKPFIKRTYSNGKLNGYYYFYKSNGKIRLIHYYIHDIFSTPPTR